MINYLLLRKQSFCLNWKNNLSRLNSMIMISNLFFILDRINKQIIRKIRINHKVTILKNLNLQNLQNNKINLFRASTSSIEIFNDKIYMILNNINN